MTYGRTAAGIQGGVERRTLARRRLRPLALLLGVWQGVLMPPGQRTRHACVRPRRALGHVLRPALGCALCSALRLVLRPTLGHHPAATGRSPGWRTGGNLRRTLHPGCQGRLPPQSRGFPNDMQAHHRRHPGRCERRTPVRCRLRLLVLSLRVRQRYRVVRVVLLAPVVGGGRRPGLRGVQITCGLTAAGIRGGVSVERQYVAVCVLWRRHWGRGGGTVSGVSK